MYALFSCKAVQWTAILGCGDYIPNEVTLMSLQIV